MQTISYSFEVKIFIGLCHIHEVTVSLIIRAFGLSNTNLLGNSNFEQPNHLLVTFTTNPQGKTFISCPSEAKQSRYILQASDLYILPQSNFLCTNVDGVESPPKKVFCTPFFPSLPTVNFIKLESSRPVLLLLHPNGRIRLVSCTSL